MKSQIENHKLKNKRRSAFTLVELLVVILIIGVLMGILIPVVSSARQSARVAATQALMSSLQAAIERYYQDFHAYPGPINNGDIYSATCNVGVVASAPGYNLIFNRANITGSENLVLGLMGGLVPGPGNTVLYDPTKVGLGPVSLGAITKQYAPYIDAEKDLSWKKDAPSITGHFQDEASAPAGANDSIIPEFVDKFPNPLPILYLRCRQSVQTVGATAGNNPIITDGTGANPLGPYALNDIIGYTGTGIGMGKTLKASDYVGGPIYPQHGLQTVNLGASLTPGAGTYTYPYNAYPYFLNPSMPGVPRAKDTYILISAGKDRVYGTEDDITSFGQVTP